MAQSQYYWYPQTQVPAATADQHCLSTGQMYAPSPETQQQAWYPYYQQYYQQGMAPDGSFQYPSDSPAAQPNGFSSWFNFSNSGYIKGLVIGAGAALLLTNPAVQHALISGSIKIWSLFQGGIEEMKEQVHDIRAEMSQKDV